MQDSSQNQSQSVVAQNSEPVAAPAQPNGNPTDSLNVPAKIEHEPVRTVSSEAAGIDAVKIEIAESSTPEVKIPQELAGIVEKSIDAKEIKLDKEVSLAGAVPAAESTPVITTPSGNIHLPMTYTEAVHLKKSSKSLDSDHWLSSVIMFLWGKYDPDLVKELRQTKQV